MNTKVNKITAALLSRKHPDYEEFLEQWDMYEDTYKGGRKWFKKHIHKYHKEGNDEFTTRVERAYRFNHPKEVVDLVGKYLFRGEISRKEDAPKEIQAFWKRMSKRGWTVKEMMPVLNKWASVFGRIWVVVDAKSLASTGTTVKDVKDAGYRVWCHWVRPQDMLDCAYSEDDGELDWVLIRESYRVNANSALSLDGGHRYRYRLWTRKSWFLYEYEVDGKGDVTENLAETDNGNHDLNMVPVIPLDNQSSSEDYTSPSLIADIAYLDKAVANYLSNLDAIIQDQTFSQLAMPAQAAIMSGAGKDDEKQRENMIAVGKKRVFLYDGEGNGQPFFLSPDPKQAELIITAIKQIINEIYHSVGVAGERTKQDNSQGIDNSSGVAKAYDFDRVNSLLTNKGETLQRFENRLCRLVMKWHGHDEVNDDEQWVTYPPSYDIRGFADELNISERLDLITAPLKLKQHQLKRAVDKMYPSMDEKTRKELHAAINDMKDALELLPGTGDPDAANPALPNEQNQEANRDDDD